MGKREEAHYFVEDTLGHGLEGCNYLLAVDMEMDPQPGYEMASWERGYGDFHLLPDLATLRRVPWLEATAIVLCDVAWGDGSPVVASPRQVLAAQIERARAAGLEPMFGSELEFYLLKESYAEAAEKHFRDLTPSVPYILDYHLLATTYDENVIRQIRNGMQQAGIPVESSKGEAWAGQHEINFRFADAMRMADNHVVYKNGAKEIAHANGCSITFMAKTRPLDVDRELVPHPYTQRASGVTAGTCSRPVTRSSIRSSQVGSPTAASSRCFSRRTSTPTSATPPRAGRRPRSRGGTTTERAGSASSVTAARSGSRPGFRGRRQPVPGVRSADRRGARRDRGRARAAAGVGGERLRIGRSALPGNAPRGDRRARCRNDGEGGDGRRGRRPLSELRTQRAAALRPDRYLLGA